MDPPQQSENTKGAQPKASRSRGGWITFPFIMATMAGLSLAAGGWVSNLIVYLIEEFNIKSIRAAKIYNFVNGCITLFPIVGAIIADSFLGCFSVGIVVLVLTAAIKTLRPLGCSTASSNMCQDPSDIQRAILYSGLALASLGIGGTRFTIGPMGAVEIEGIFKCLKMQGIETPS
ncbi:transporter [Lithospermum erythrorhizon]|uniref:Transporter n=1 Tax=Lithospermum erythrorhizon TaxID=34254 RepID=A0AAV3RUK1_LITER